MSARKELVKEPADVATTTLYTVVKGREDDEQWKEVADLVSISATGAGFYLARECKVGNLVSLMIPLPAHLRCYDHEKELYRVWGLVQHCQLISGDDINGYHVGVAFIGKRAPASYDRDPAQSYRICGMSEDGLWKIEDARTPFKARRHIRYWKTIDLYLAQLDSRKQSIGGERTVTENISKSGAAVFSTLDVEVGDRVKFISEEYDFSGLAVVCNRQVGDDDRARLHLQFVENTFPVETLGKTETDTRE